MSDVLRGLVSKWYDLPIVYTIILYLILSLLIILTGRWNKGRRLAGVWGILAALCVGMLALIGVSVYLALTPPATLDDYPLIHIAAALGYLDLFIWLLCGAFAKRKNE